MMRLLLLGGTGQVGEELRALPRSKDIEIVAPTEFELDLKDSNAIAHAIMAGRWSAVINAAAYTDVDRAESEEPVAFAVNAEAPARLASETGRAGIPLVHISTDYVFDGSKGAPYVEEDKPAPLNAYGRSKLAGETGVRAGNRQHIILRSSWVYSPFRKNFVRTILRLAAERNELKIVADQRGCPTVARDLAQTCLDIAVRCATERDQAPYGTYHFAGAGETTWFEFADVIVDLASARLGRKPSVLPIRTIEYPTPALRPADSRLDCSAIVRTFGINPRPWRQSVAETIDRLLTKENVP
jgi:dTDP-4-dehydrorhamnose reductase